VNVLYLQQRRKQCLKTKLKLLKKLKRKSTDEEVEIKELMRLLKKNLKRIRRREKAESTEEVMEEVEKEEDFEEELEARDPNESIPMVNLLSAEPESLQHGDLVNFNEKMFRVTKIATAQSPIFKFLEIDAEGKDCDNVLNVNADELSSQSETKSQRVKTRFLTKV
jgi:CO dehydrogenase/acetyl-CoA synthase beta subunit